MSAVLNTKPQSHIASAIMAGAISVAYQKHGLEPGASMSWSIDQHLMAGLPAALIFAAIFLGGHLFFRHIKISYSWLYSLLGGVALSAAILIPQGEQLLALAIDQGILSLALALLVAGGSLIGFVHFKSAGFDATDDKPEELAKLVHSTSSFELNIPNSDIRQKMAGTTGAEISSDRAHVSTGNEEYFDGPLQVVTSGKSIVIAGIIGGMAYSILQFIFVGNSLLMDPENFNLDLGENVPGVIAYGALFGTIMFPVPIYVCHLFARSRQYTDIKNYALVGAGFPVVLGLAMFVVGLIVTAIFIIPMTVSMVVYRKLAGLEPADIPEDIQVKDRRTLVGKNHERRTYSRIVAK